MTDNRRHPQQADETGFAPSDPQHPQNLATKPAQRVPEGYASPAITSLADALPARPKTVTNLEIFDLLNTMRSENAREVGDIKRDVREVRDGQRDDRLRIAKLEAAQAGPPRAPSKSLLDMDEEQLAAESAGAMSQDDRMARLERGTIRAKRETKRTTNTQTGALIGAMVVLLGAASQYLAARAEATARDLAAQTAAQAERAAEKAAKEAAAEAAKATKEKP